MSGLIRAEWLRLAHRGDIWIVGLIVVAINVIGYISGVSSAQSIEFGFAPGEEIPPDLLEELEAMKREALAALTFPQSLEATLVNGRFLVFVLAAYLAAAVTGAEFEYATIRTSLVARGDRRGFVIVRLLAVAAMAAGMLALTILLSIVLPLAAAALGVDLPPVDGPSLISVVGMIGATLLTGAFIIGLATMVALVFRSAVVSIVLTLATVLADGAVGGLIARFLGEDSPLRWATPLGNAQLLFDRAIGTQTGAEWPLPVAVAVGLGWVALVWAGSVVALARADVNA